jgi:hypothetical protein
LNALIRWVKGGGELLSSIELNEKLNKTSSKVETVVASWIEEQRNLNLQLSKLAGKTVKLKIKQNLQDNPIDRLKQEINNFITSQCLSAKYQIPDAASDLWIEVDLAKKCIEVSMRVNAPSDKMSTKARLNWLMRMLKKDDERIIIRALWPAKTSSTQKTLLELRENPTALQIENTNVAPRAFEVLLVEEIGGKFDGARTFIKSLEKIISEFYKLIEQYLRAWQPPPPKPLAITKGQQKNR